MGIAYAEDHFKYQHIINMKLASLIALSHLALAALQPASASQNSDMGSLQNSSSSSMNLQTSQDAGQVSNFRQDRTPNQMMEEQSLMKLLESGKAIIRHIEVDGVMMPIVQRPAA